MEKTNEIYQNLQRFANEHKLILEDHGEVGFGRPCVGFLHGHNYVDYNPMNLESFEYIPGFKIDDPVPSGVNAYHKHDCMAVLVENDDYDEALRQLNEWVKHLESLGTVEIVQYETGARGMQAVISGFFGKAIKISKAETQ
jgi:hypothetical protein